MNPLVRDLYKRFIMVGREYPASAASASPRTPLPCPRARSSFREADHDSGGLAHPRNRPALLIGACPTFGTGWPRVGAPEDEGGVQGGMCSSWQRGHVARRGWPLCSPRLCWARWVANEALGSALQCRIGVATRS